MRPAIFAGISANESDQFVDGLCLHRRIDHENVRRGDGKRNRVEVLVWVIGDLGEDGRVYAIRVICSEESIAIRDGLRSLGDTDIPAGTGNIFDIELFAKPLTELLSDEPREDIGGAACSIWYQHSHWARRVRLRHRQARNGGERRTTGC